MNVSEVCFSFHILLWQELTVKITCSKRLILKTILLYRSMLLNELSKVFIANLGIKQKKLSLNG